MRTGDRRKTRSLIAYDRANGSGWCPWRDEEGDNVRLFRNGGVILMAVWGATVLAGAQSPATTAADTRDGVYTAEQAERGRVAFQQYCARCHRDDLGGQNGPALKGNRFLDQWREFTLEVIFNAVRTTMPPRRGGPRPQIADAVYLDIIAFLLQGNDLPQGSRELTAGDVATIALIERDGPRPLPSSSLVELVACFRRGEDKAWILSNASRPKRTLQTDITDPEREAIERVELAQTVFRLQGLDTIGDFFAEEYPDAKVHVKGYLIQQPNRERINLTALEVIGYRGCRD